MRIPMVEGAIRRVLAQMDGVFYAEHYEIACPHSSHSVGRALANVFAPSDEVVVIRKNDYEALTKKVAYLERCLKEDKPWLAK